MIIFKVQFSWTAGLSGTEENADGESGGSCRYDSVNVIHNQLLTALQGKTRQFMLYWETSL